MLHRIFLSILIIELCNFQVMLNRMDIIICLNRSYYIYIYINLIVKFNYFNASLYLANVSNKPAASL